MKDILTLPVRDLVMRIARREISTEAVIRACIERIEADEHWVQAWQYFDSALALRQARLCDAGPVAGPLHGLPIGVKDLMDTASRLSAFCTGPFAPRQ